MATLNIELAETSRKAGSVSRPGATTLTIAHLKQVGGSHDDVTKSPQLAAAGATAAAAAHEGGAQQRSPPGSLFSLYQQQPTTGVAYYAAGYGSSGLEFITSPYAKSRDQSHTVLVLGAAAVGKSSLVLHLVKDWSERNRSTYDPYEKSIVFKCYGEEKTINLVEVDSEKDDLWRSVCASGALLVYSVTDWSTFRQAQRLADRVRASVLCDGQPMWLVATHADAEPDRWAVPHSDVQSASKRFKCDTAEVAVNKLISPAPQCAAGATPVYDLATAMVRVYSNATLTSAQQHKRADADSDSADRHAPAAPATAATPPSSSAARRRRSPPTVGASALGTCTSRIQMLRSRITRHQQQRQHSGTDAAANAIAWRKLSRSCDNLAYCPL